MVKAKSARKHEPGTRAPAASGPWQKHFFQRHREDDRTQAVPAQNFLLACPEKVRAMILAVVNAVAEAPPPQFSGGGKWEAMHGEMAGYYEIRVDGPGRHHYRLFCLLERDGRAVGLGGPSLVLICGRDKPFRTVLSAPDYGEVRRLGSEFLGRDPRSVLR
jgi:Txe/YoeB family toxin of Txe-Axe toxin-antitoxin module